MSDAIPAELARLRGTVETLTPGLRMMVETQGTHTEMLQAILEAATEEAGESPLTHRQPDPDTGGDRDHPRATTLRDCTSSI